MKRNPDVVFICLKGLLPGPSHAVQQLPLHLLRKQLFTRSSLPTTQRRAARDIQVYSRAQQPPANLALSTNLAKWVMAFSPAEKPLQEQMWQHGPMCHTAPPTHISCLRGQKHGLVRKQRKNWFCVNVHWPVLPNSRPGTGPCLAGGGLNGYSRLRFYIFSIFSQLIFSFSQLSFPFPLCHICSARKLAGCFIALNVQLFCYSFHICTVICPFPSESEHHSKQPCEVQSIILFLHEVVLIFHM